MAARFEADGDTWEIGVERHSPLPGVSGVVFHCVSNPQRPYRVLPLGSDVVARQGEFEGDVPAERLREMFAKSQIMDYTHDPEANPNNFAPRTEP